MGETSTIDNELWSLPFNQTDIIDETLPPELDEKLRRRTNLVGKASIHLASNQSPESEPADQILDNDDAPYDYDPRKDETIFRYPDLWFKFNESWLFRSGIVEPSLQSRTRAVLYAAKDASKQEEATNTLEWPDMAQLEKQAKAALSLSKKEVAIALNVKVKQSNFLPFESALEIVRNQFARENHPIYQALRNLRTYSTEALPVSIVQQIESTLYSGLAYEDLKKIYQRAHRKVKMSGLRVKDSV